MALVLVIDDDPMLRELAVFALREAGHNVLDASGGDAGLALVRVEKPDLVVCDVNMPGTDGFAVLEALRADPDTAAVPVVMCTSLGERENMRRGMRSGADDYLPKPYQPQELIDAVNAVLARHDARHFKTVALVKDRFNQALERQEQVLAARYEHQLEQEFSSRWDKQLAEQGQLDFKAGTVLLADLFAALRAEGQPDASDVASILQSARDSLFLFGAAIVLPHGDEILAIFDSGKDDIRTPAVERAVRAAFALQTAVGMALGGATTGGMSVALHRGDFSVVMVNDPLHGDTSTTVVPSAALAEASTLRQLGKAKRWGVTASRAVCDALPEGVARAGAKAGSGFELRQPD
ncbi:MAG: response regulator [Burkholderiales bacterium]|nr:response regulator [Burkholderiales bacterium]